MRTILLAATLVAALSGCAQVSRPGPQATLVAEETPTGWKAIASDDDVARVAALPQTWQTLFVGARARRARLVDAHGTLLKLDAALDFPTPPPGSYRCKLIRLRPGTRRTAPISALGESFCHVRGESEQRLAFSKQTGTELPAGWLYPDGDRRFILLGARQRRAGETSLAYGEDKTRDIAGVLERIGPFRWRLMIQGTGTQPSLDIYELTPVPAERQAAEPS